MKLDYGGVVLADGVVLEGKLIQARSVLPAGGEDESFERAPPSSLAAKPAGFEGRCSQTTFTVLHFVFSWTWVIRS